jgi:hypothetical protein
MIKMNKSWRQFFFKKNTHAFVMPGFFLYLGAFFVVFFLFADSPFENPIHCKMHVSRQHVLTTEMLTTVHV